MNRKNTLLTCLFVFIVQPLSWKTSNENIGKFNLAYLILPVFSVCSIEYTEYFSQNILGYRINSPIIYDLKCFCLFKKCHRKNFSGNLFCQKKKVWTPVENNRYVMKCLQWMFFCYEIDWNKSKLLDDHTLWFFFLFQEILQYQESNSQFEN